MPRFMFSHFTYLALTVTLLNPSLLAAQAPQKFLDADLKIPAQNETRFPNQLVNNRQFVEEKKREWAACHQSQSRVQNLYPGQDPLEAFLESQNITRSLQGMEQNNLQSGRTLVQPWSGDYWPYASGLLAARVFDEDFLELQDWPARNTYVQQNPATLLLRQENDKKLALLSAAEKLDLVSGDVNFIFTQSMWSQGKRYYDAYGKVENWMGLCHGWAPAAIMEPRPSRKVIISSFNQQWQVPLFPSEVKGLLSYSWAANPYPHVLLGERCDKKEPVRDSNGRLIDPECLDLSPAIWHLAVVNKVGLQKKSFVMDATYDYEVWNQPVLAYSYKYFNVTTRDMASRLTDAKVKIADYIKDPFQKYRSPQTQYIVGISMRVAYIAETSADSSEHDSPENDAIRWVSYDYDLELDKDGVIIDGEWYQTAHPDFIWNPTLSASPRTYLDRGLSVSDWKGTAPIPEKWSKYAQAGAKSGLLLYTLARALGLRSQSPLPEVIHTSVSP